MKRDTTFYRFMLITQKNNIPTPKYLDFIKKCADGGITSLQLREKSLSQGELIELGEALIEILAPYNIPLVVNDFSLLAQKLNTSYLHIGQKDDSITKAFQIIPHARVGVSIDTIENLYTANEQKNISYVTASAVFPTENKNNVQTIWGLEGLKNLSLLSKHPLTAIGGITLENTKDIIKQGAKGIALIGAIHNTDNPYQLCKKFRNILDQELEKYND